MSFSAFTSSESGRARHGEAALGACHQLGYQSDPTLARSPDEFATDSVTVAAERRASTATSPAEADGESYISPHGLEESHATSRRTSLASASSLTSLSSASSTSSSAPLLKAQASVSSSIESSLQIPHSITPGNTHFRVASLGAITEVSENSNHFAEETGPTFQSRDSCSKSLAYSKNKALESTFQPITPEVKKSSVSSSITAVGDVSDDGFDDYDEKNKVDSDRPGPNGGVGPSGPEKEFMGHDKGFWSFRNVLIFSMACFGGLLFGFHTGYISGVLAMDFVENMQIAYNQRSEGWRSVTSIKHVDYPNGTHMVSRNESWTSSSGQQFGAGLPILGPINANNLWEALNYTQSNLDWNHLDIDTQTEIDAAFGWNNSSAPSWLLLDENVRPFWLCHISTHHIHKLGGDHHGDHLQHVREPEDDQDPTNMKSHYRYVSMAINRREEAAKTAAAPLPFEFTHHPRWFRLTAKERLLTVGMLSLGTAVGALFGGDISDYLGRRLTLVIGTVIFMIGVADQLASVDLASLTRGRAESGIAVGFITSVIRKYMISFYVVLIYSVLVDPWAHPGKSWAHLGNPRIGHSCIAFLPDHRREEDILLQYLYRQHHMYA
ncbi:hypothetical protein QBC38DRAFT_268602 [Podospora fimiseda]|uniref:Uncharacterized protein n=1 Tax=Podospora fimiseda TaxID=252190 RepID=A0AAN7GRJ2_9PEZI|nr:hypothetical protein QBC38DRAFT_268602 [Podospora fimiseda]